MHRRKNSPGLRTRCRGGGETVARDGAMRLEAHALPQCSLEKTGERKYTDRPPPDRLNHSPGLMHKMYLVPAAAKRSVASIAEFTAVAPG